MKEPAVLDLPEYKEVSFPASALPEAAVRLLVEHYPAQIAVNPPTFLNNYHWQLTNLGWVGHIPLNDEFHVALTPKVPLANLFRMLEYAYRLQSFQLLSGEIKSDSLNDLYERLANILAKRVLGRSRQGFYRAYIPRQETLPYLRGRLDLRQSLTRPWKVALPCHYQEHTADIEDNQILTWALFTIARSGNCSERVQPTVRRAYRTLQNLTALTPFEAQACLNRFYHRLNDDYRPLHGLARFFLEQRGPSHQLGERTMLPFLVDMARLFELFVAEWLRSHLPPELRLKEQHRVELDQANGLHFQIDLQLEEATTGAVRWVLDTKYKAPEKPSTADVSQIIAYAQNQGAPNGALVYPVALPQLLHAASREIRLRSLTFALDGDLEAAGQDFLRQLTTETRLD